MPVTLFKEKDKDLIHATLPYLYLPNESHTKVMLNGQRITGLFPTDVINDNDVTRTIYFSYWKEPAADHADQEDTTQTKIPYRH